MRDTRILGDLRVLDDDGRAIDLGGGRQRIVLAVLLLECPRTVPVDRLIDAVWPDGPPATARSQIQISVSNLRQRLGALAVIVTSAPGYAVELDGLRLDRLRFEADVAAARAAVAMGRRDEAVEAFRRALGHWGGTAALPGLGSPTVARAATHLEDDRLAAVEELCELLLASGRHREVVTTAGRELSEHPLRERLRGQRMLGLYGSGRQADALREFRTGRDHSISELGIEPSAALRRLEAAILRDEPGLVVREEAVGPYGTAAAIDPEGQGASTDDLPTPRMLPAEIGDFGGRQALIGSTLAELRRGGRGGDVSSPRVLVLTGQGGVGKSALAIHLAHRLSGEHPDAHLFASMGAGPHAASPDSVLARFLRALRVPPAAIPAGLGERAALFREHLAGRAALVLVDDASLESQVLPLLPPDGNSLVLVTSRRRLTALPAATRVELGPFSDEDAVAFAERVIGSPRSATDPDAMLEMVQLCHRLPFAIRIASARVAARPHWSIRTMVDRLSDETAHLDELQHGDMAVRGSLLLTYEQLAPAARQLLRHLALLNTPHVGGWVSSLLLAGGTRDAHDSLDELVELHLVEVDTSTTDDPWAVQYHLHELVRLFARERSMVEDSAHERTAAIRRFLGGVLHLAREAHRREYGGDALIVHSPVVPTPVDGPLVDRLLRRPLAWMSRERQVLVAAVSQAAAIRAADLAWDIAISSVVLFEALGHYDDWRLTQAVALDAAVAQNDPLGQATMLYSRGSLALFQQDYIGAEADLLAASDTFVALRHRHAAALAERNRAVVERFTGRLDRAQRRAEEVLEVLRELEDHAAQAHVLSNLAQLALDRGDTAAALAHVEEADRACLHVPHERVTAQITARHGQILLDRGDGAAAADKFRLVLEFATRLADRTAEMYGLLGLGEALTLDGHLDEGRSTISRALDLARSQNDRRVQARCDFLLARIAHAEGDRARARELAERSLELCRSTGLVLYASMCLVLIGDIADIVGNRAAALSNWKSARTVLLDVDPGLSSELAHELGRRLGPAH